MSFLACPNCDEEILTDNLRLLDVFECRQCDTRLEVVDVNPFAIEFHEPDDDFEPEFEDDDDEDEE